MATYIEIHDAIAGAAFADLRKRIQTAVLKKAQTVIDADDQPFSRRNWARSVFSDTPEETERMLSYLVAKNSSLAVATIAATNDAAAQTAVNSAVDLIFSH
jgi:hypothetical protein